MKKTLTVFTPTYNRAYTLERLYDSLTAQTNKDFEWLIIDDGSTDNTELLISRLINKTNEFNIRYFKQKNGGKHRAMNRAITLAEGEYFITCDSNKYLDINAVNTILNTFSAIENLPQMCGVGGYRADFSGNIYGGEMEKTKEGYIDCTNNERSKHKLNGDHSTAFYTRILKKYLSPEFEGESFISETCWLIPMAHDGYRIRWIPKIFCYGEYSNDGLTKMGANGFVGDYNNCFGFFYITRKKIEAFGWRLVVADIYEAIDIAEAKDISLKQLHSLLGISVTMLLVLKYRRRLGIIKRNTNSLSDYFNLIIRVCYDKITIKDKNIIVFDPKTGSLNLGDWIISYYSHLQLGLLFHEDNIDVLTTHLLPNAESIKSINSYRTKIVCGTNLMTSHFEVNSNWKIPYNLVGYRGIITLGVGWDSYSEDISDRSRFVYNAILSRKGLHSVRDSYTEMKFHQMGIHNVINTGCVTLWNLTKEHCQKIPKHKCDRVITTITDYDTDETNDKLMLDILLDKYREVFVWLQGTADEKYLRKYHQFEKLSIIGNDLNSFNSILSQSKIDYVGTRLHAGIHAMNYGIRSIIIAIDNRAIEMGKDFNLPIILRDEIKEKLADKIDNDFETIIRLPNEKIEKWKSQFRM